MSDRSYRYRAFISYRHVDPDRRWAKWLHTSIESYRVPQRLQRSGRVQDRLGRVFRDEEEFSASPNLTREIQLALEESEFLIVVCSPRTPESEWVNQEVVRFRQLGRDDRILALLIEGEPNQAFPRALCEIRKIAGGDTPDLQELIEKVEPLAADVRSRSSESMRRVKRTALLRLLATLIGCKFDDLWQRDRERRRRQLVYRGVFAAVLSALFLGLTIYAKNLWDNIVTARGRENLAAASDRAAAGDHRTGLWQLQRTYNELPKNHPLRAIALNFFAVEESLAERVFVQPGSVRAVALSPQGKTILAASGAEAWLWSTDPRDEPRVLAAGDEITAATYSPDGKTIVTGSRGGQVLLWNSDTVARVGPLLANDATQVIAVAFSSQGDKLLAVSGNRVRLWSVDAARRASPLGDLAHEPPNETVRAAAFSPDGSYLLTAAGERAWLWSIEQRAIVADLEPPREPKEVRSVAFSPDGSLLFTANGPWVQAWEADLTGKADAAKTIDALGEPLFHSEPVTHIVVSPDGTKLLSAVKGSVKISNVKLQQPGYDPTVKELKLEAIGKPLQHAETITSVVFSADGLRILTGSADHTARLWLTTNAEPHGDPLWGGDSDTEDHSVTSVALSPDAKTAAIAKWDSQGGGFARLWNTDWGQTVSDKLWHDQIRMAAFDDDGSHLLTAGGELVQLWSIVGHEPRVEQKLEFDVSIRTAAFDAGRGRLVTACEDGSVALCDLKTGLKRRMPMAASQEQSVNAATSVAISPSGDTVVAARGRQAWLWNVAEPTVAQAIEQAGEVLAVAFSPDGRYFVAGCNEGSTQLWDCRSGLRYGDPLRQDAAVTAVAFSPDGRTIVTGSKTIGGDGDQQSPSGLVQLWDAETSLPLTVPFRHDGTITSIACRRDERGEFILLSGSEDKTARIWHLPAPDLRAADFLDSLTEWQTALRITGSSMLSLSPDSGPPLGLSFSDCAPPVRSWDKRPARGSTNRRRSRRGMTGGPISSRPTRRSTINWIATGVMPGYFISTICWRRRRPIRPPHRNRGLSNSAGTERTRSVILRVARAGWNTGVARPMIFRSCSTIIVGRQLLTPRNSPNPATA